VFGGVALLYVKSETKLIGAVGKILSVYIENDLKKILQRTMPSGFQIVYIIESEMVLCMYDLTDSAFERDQPFRRILYEI
jgi:hypothetical protein